MYLGQTSYYLALEVAFNPSWYNNRHSDDGRLAGSPALLLVRLQFHPSSTRPFNVIIIANQKKKMGKNYRHTKCMAIWRVIDGKLHLIRELVSMKCQPNRQNLLSEELGSWRGVLALKIKINNHIGRMTITINQPIVRVKSSTSRYIRQKISVLKSYYKNQLQCFWLLFPPT